MHYTPLIWTETDELEKDVAEIIKAVENVQDHILEITKVLQAWAPIIESLCQRVKALEGANAGRIKRVGGNAATTSKRNKKSGSRNQKRN